MSSSAGEDDLIFDDWVIIPSTHAGDSGEDSDGKWVLVGTDCPRFHSIGFFLVSIGGRHIYTPLVSSDATYFTDCLSSLPSQATICASFCSVILARSPCSQYYVFSKDFPHWTPIINSIHPHSDSVHVAITSAAGDGREKGFLIICAVPRPDAPSGFYRIEYYDSSTRSWIDGPDCFPMGAIVPSSGVSCGTAAYFRTSTPSVAAFDASTGLARVLPPPPKCWDMEVIWELEESNGQLQCLCVRQNALDLFRLGEIDQWERVRAVLVKRTVEPEWNGDEPILCSTLPRPLRSQGMGDGVSLWVDGRVGRWDLERGRTIGFWTGKRLPTPGRLVAYVPYCGNQ